MKKKLFLIFAALFLTCLLTAEQNKYYKKDRLVNTLYVNSIEGLKVRDTPSLNGKRICGLVNAMPVKIVAVGSSAEIDGIKYYNDSKGTNCDSSICALKAFKDKVVSLESTIPWSKSKHEHPVRQMDADNIKARENLFFIL